MPINILCLGDVVGRAGRCVLADHLQDVIRDRQIELVVCNAENAAGGSGLTPVAFEKLLSYGVDVVTLGDHAFRKGEIVPVMEKSPRLIRPANLSPLAAGKGWTVVSTRSGAHQVAVVALLGQLYMGQNDSPWTAIDAILEKIPSEVKIRVVDFHSEASSEKIAMGWHLNGRVSVLFGTHTHVPTADARVLDKGTAAISDVGMTGPYDSVLGRRKDRVLHFLRTSMPAHFEVARGDPRMSGIVASVEPTTGRALAVERIEVAGKIPEGGPYDEQDGMPPRRK